MIMLGDYCRKCFRKWDKCKCLEKQQREMSKRMTTWKEHYLKMKHAPNAEASK